MAFLFGDSFDHYGTTKLARKGWSLGYSGYATIGAYGRNSTNGLRLFQDNVTTAQWMSGPSLVTSGNVVVIGFAINRTASTETFPLFTILRAGGIQFGVDLISSSGVLEFRRTSGFASGTLITTTNTAITAGVWTHVQIKVTCHPSAGTIDVKFDGANDATAYGLTGLNTALSGTAGWTQLRWGNVSSGPGFGAQDTTVDIDDFVLLDGSGSLNNDFIGDVRGVCLLPSTGNGTHTDWDPSTGTDRGALVDETDPNDDTDYVSSGASGERVSFNFPAVGVTGTVYAVQTNNYLKAQVAGVRSAGSTIRISSTDYDAAGESIGSDWSYQREVHEESPATSTAWTVSEIDGAEFGAKVTA